MKEEATELNSALCRFRQQTMKGYFPIPDYLSHIMILLISGILLILFGFAYLYFLTKLDEYRFRYDNKTGCVIGGFCNIQIEIPK